MDSPPTRDHWTAVVDEIEMVLGHRPDHETALAGLEAILDLDGKGLAAETYRRCFRQIREALGLNVDDIKFLHSRDAWAGALAAWDNAVAEDQAAHERNKMAIVEQARQGTYRELMADDSPDVEWVIPGFIGRGEMFFLTGGEGTGKTTFAYQVATLADQGLHPFTLEPTDHRPLVTVYELEVNKAHLRRFLNERHLAHEPQVNFDLDTLGQSQEIVPDGEDVTAFVNYVLSMQELRGDDLVIIGPHSKLSATAWMTSGQAEFAAAFVRLTNELKRRGCAIIVTGISSHNGSKPMGSKILAHESDFGYELTVTEAGRRKLRPWRNDRDDSRDIPTEFQMRDGWPFAIKSDQWQTIKRAIVLAESKPSPRELADTTGIPKSTVDRIIKEHRDEYDVIVAT